MDRLTALLDANVLFFLPQPDLKPIESSRLKALAAAERTVDGLWAAIARILETLRPRNAETTSPPPVSIQADRNRSNES